MITQPLIKPIETQYKGYRFRSRLEARWAVFFDALGWSWEYEKEGFDLGNGMYYLPDFWLSDPKVFVEVKPDYPSEDEWKKAEFLAPLHSVIMAVGMPDAIAYAMVQTFYSKEIGIQPVLFGWHKGEVGNLERIFADVGVREDNWLGDEYKQAMIAARSARFEHGERG